MMLVSLFHHYFEQLMLTKVPQFSHLLNFLLCTVKLRQSEYHTLLQTYF